MHHSRSVASTRPADEFASLGDGSPRIADPRRLRLACLLIYAGLLLTLVGVFFSPSEALARSNYQTTQHWTVDDGLAQNSVRAMAVDATGYLWLGTADGLSRFDGVRFRNYRLIDHPALGSNRIQALETTPDGTVWIGTDHRGLVRYRNGLFRSSAICDQRCQVIEIAASTKGHLWVLSSVALHRVDQATGQPDRRLDLGVQAPPVMRLLALPGGGAAFALGTSLRIHAADGDLVAELEVDPGVEILALGLLDAQPVAVTTNGLFAFGPHGRVAEPESVARPFAGADRIRSAAFAGTTLAVQTHAEDTLWFKGMPDAASRLRRIEIDPSPQVISALDGAADDLWLGTALNGLLRVSPSRVFGDRGYRNSDLGAVLPIVDHPESGVLVGGVCSGLLHIDEDREVREVAGTGEEIQQCVWTLHAQPGGSVLIGGFRGRIQVLKSGRVESLAMSHGDDSISRANFMLRGKGGRVWLGARDGLFRIDGDQVTPIDGAPEGIALLSGSLRADGSLLLGSSSGLYEFDGSEVRRIETGQRIDALPIRSILRLDDGEWLFGTYGGGLWRLHAGRWFQAGSAQGLVEDVVSCMLTDTRGRLWTSGNRGISAIELSELRQLAEGLRGRLHAWALTEDDGLPTSETNGGGQPACHRDREGRLWFPTVAGPVAFDPVAIGRFEPAGRLLIESVHLDGRPLSRAGPLRLPSDARNLEIQYTVPQFENAHRLRFRYRLAGVDDEWVEAGARRIASYPVLPRGEYRFEVQLGVDDGRWLNSVEGVEFIRPNPGIRVDPWLLALMVAALAALLGFFRWRLVALRRRDIKLNAIIDERTQKLREMNVRLAELSRTDELTGIANHRRFRFYLADQWRIAAKEGRGISIVLLDVDHFKQFNDSLGHPAGDRVLHSIAQLLSHRVAAVGGLLARYGGEEFVAVLPNRTLEQAREVAESLRRAVESLAIEDPEVGTASVTISLGVAAANPSAGGSPDALVQRADEAMYAAKLAGRNRVVSD